MASENETLRRLSVELQMLESTAEALQSRINQVYAALTELRIATATLEGLEKEKKNTPLFVPIGGGSYIKAKLQSFESVIVGVGAGIAIEKTMKEAKENVGKRLTELEKTGMALQQQLTQVIENIREGRTTFQDLTAKINEREKRKAV